MKTEGRDKLVRVFRYLEAINELRNPPQKDIDKYDFRVYLSDLPDHPNVIIGNEEKVFSVRRPVSTLCPVPPASIKPWLMEGWEKPSPEPRIVADDPDEDAPDSERFEDEPARVREFDLWLSKWREWSPIRKLELRVEWLYQLMYEQYSLLERDGERFELVLGDGFVKWRLPEGSVNHPVLLQPVELIFDPVSALFTVLEVARPVEFYSAPLRAEDVSAQTLAKIRLQIQETPEIHPLEQVMTTPFLRGMAASLDNNGLFVDDSTFEESSDARVFRSPVLFRRNRNVGLSQAIRQVLDDLSIEPGGEVSPSWLDGPPEGLMRFVGIETRPGEPSIVDQGLIDAIEDDEETFFTKPANHEQHQIVRKLRSTGCVLVQGPPGTGKTHTIANLVGHLLAEGKSVLVTSHTTKALSVLTDKVVEPLRPLCVSVLESDAKNRELLEHSVQSMADRLTVGSGVYSRRISELQQRRKSLYANSRDLRRRLRSARASEYEPIAFRGEAIKPVDAAKIVAAGDGKLDWIPGKVETRDYPPLTEQELAVLYESNTAIEPEDELNVPEEFPDLESINSPDEYEAALTNALLLREAEKEIPNSVVTRPLTGDLSVVESALKLLSETISMFSSDGDGWKRQIVDLAHQGEADGWLHLASEVETLKAQVGKSMDLVLRVDPRWTGDTNYSEIIARCLEIEAFLASGRKLSNAVLMVHPAWRNIIRFLAVAGGKPSSPEHFAALRASLETKHKQDELLRVWNGRMSQISGPTLAQGCENPERQAFPHCLDIRECVTWQRESWQRLDNSITATGLSSKAALLAVPAATGPAPTIERRIRSLEAILLPSLRNLHNRIQSAAAEERLSKIKKATASLLSEFPQIPLIRDLELAARTESSDGYRNAHSELITVHRKADAIALRRSMLATLASSCPEWAKAIRSRQGHHGLASIPADVTPAWKWKQLSQELQARASISIQEIVSALSSTRQEAERVTVDLVESMSWHELAQKTTMPMRLALSGYVQILKRIGKGTSKRVPKFILEAQKMMAASQRAVPVWVMPLSRIIESFDVGLHKFDVVIIDEASQLDLMGLLAMYMARQVIIVGDDKQVEPLAVGANLDETQSLIDEHLEGIPRNQLWDGKQSVYSLADGPFEPIRLREHFRCVPDIIRFSNQLSYGTILPLREETGVSTLPFVVPYYVHGAYVDNKRNLKEADALVALMKACCEQPEYEGKTIGVIHLVGDERSPQSQYVERLARQEIGDVELHARKFRCGNSAQFQGDERDIMFLSVVDVPSSGPLSMRSEDLYKKRFNVAASRARDQMWVIYSLDPNTDLKPGDLRRDLITYALDPKAQERVFQGNAGATESDFELRVLKHFTDAGYSTIQPQYKVGAYRLDFAFRQGDLRIAIECDGERFHGSDKLDEDLARQATLERLGWQFIRVRGSEFYRDEAKAMERVFEALDVWGVSKSVESTVHEAQESEELLSRVKQRAAELLEAEPENSENIDELLPLGQNGEPNAAIVEPTFASGMAVAPKSRPEPVNRAPQAVRPSQNGSLLSSQVNLVLDPYIQFASRKLPDPKTALVSEMAEVIVKIVEIEGPVTVRTVIDRYRQGAEYGRLKGPTREAVLAAIQLALRKGGILSLEHDEDFVGEVVGVPGKPKVRIRERGPRNLEDIPIQEIAELAELLGVEHEDDETAFRHILGQYELKRLTGGAEERLRRAMASLGATKQMTAPF